MTKPSGNIPHAECLPLRETKLPDRTRFGPHEGVHYLGAITGRCRAVSAPHAPWWLHNVVPACVRSRSFTRHLRLSCCLCGRYKVASCRPSQEVWFLKVTGGEHTIRYVFFTTHWNAHVSLFSHVCWCS